MCARARQNRQDMCKLQACAPGIASKVQCGKRGGGNSVCGRRRRKRAWGETTFWLMNPFTSSVSSCQVYASWLNEGESHVFNVGGGAPHLPGNGRVKGRVRVGNVRIFQAFRKESGV